LSLKGGKRAAAHKELSAPNTRDLQKAGWEKKGKISTNQEKREKRRSPGLLELFNKKRKGLCKRKRHFSVALGR